jgi:hypothetical protein
VPERPKVWHHAQRSRTEQVWRQISWRRPEGPDSVIVSDWGQRAKYKKWELYCWPHSNFYEKSHKYLFLPIYLGGSGNLVQDVNSFFATKYDTVYTMINLLERTSGVYKRYPEKFLENV